MLWFIQWFTTTHIETLIGATSILDGTMTTTWEKTKTRIGVQFTHYQITYQEHGRNMTTKTDELTGVVVAAENPLKEMLLEYVGNKFATEEDEGEFEVTVQMIVDTLAHEFPEFVMIMAEENWVRGYQQGLDDATRLHQTTPADA